MRKIATSLLLAFVISSAALAQAPVQYSVAFPNAVHHEAQVTVVFSDLKPGSLQVRMARSSPGRYALHEFAKNVYAVKATNTKGKALTITRPDPSGWDVAGHDGTVRFSYTLFGDRTDGTYAGIDERHAHLNIPATLAYARGLEERPAQVHFDLPAGWQVATQLRPEAAANTYFAPHLQYLMDSPTSLGAQQVRTWQEQGKTIELAVLHEGTAAELDTYADQTKKIVRESSAVFGELPNFDFGRYTFIANYLPQTSGDGMEHRNSTSLTSARPLRGQGAINNLGTVSHEFFHAWNVERIRPKSLEPFEFDRANQSEALWFAEGFTMYYGDLLMRRAGILSEAQYMQELTTIVNSMVNSPGARLYSPVQMSQQAPFVDAAAAIDPNNRGNTYLSYYTIGGANALALDLLLRQNYKTDLDAYMRAVWQQYGQAQQNFAPQRPYTLPDLQRILGEVARDTAFAGQFFRTHITGHELPKYEELLAPAGLLVRRANPGQPSMGLLDLAYSPQGATIVNSTLVGSPLYLAGIDREDVLMKLDGKKIKDQKELRKLLGKHKPGDVVPVEVRTRAGVRTVPITLAEVTAVEVVPAPTATPEQLAFRTAWLGSKVK
jgi:predicted metalloprotease with PDZ domain